MAENLVELTLKLNSDTGQIDVVGSKLAGISNQSNLASSSFKKLSAGAKSLFSALLPITSALALAQFFASAVKGAEEQNESMRRLKFTIESTGQSWEKGEKQIDSWAKSISKLTRFSDGEALESLDQLARATGNVSQAQKAAQLAMGLSVTSGKSLATTTQFVSDLINKQERAVTQAHKEYGVFVEKATTAQQVLDALQHVTKDAIKNDENLTSSKKKLGNSFGELKDTIGETLGPALGHIFDFTTKGIRLFKDFTIIISANVKAIYASLKGMAEALQKALVLDFGGAKQAILNIGQEIIKIDADVNEKITDNHRKTTLDQISGAEARILVSKAVSEKEVNDAQEKSSKIADLEYEMNRNIASIGQDTLKKKQELLNLEINARRQKIIREVADEVAKKRLLEKLEEEQFKRSQEMAKVELKVKEETALQTIDIGLQTLEIINSFGDEHTKGAINRAKVILALEKAIAIARIISESAGNPVLAGARIALTVAQFAQQSKSIDDAAKAYNAGKSQFSVDTKLSTDSTLTETFGVGSNAGGFGSGSASNRSNQGQGNFAAGGGGGVVINIHQGAIVIEGSADSRIAELIGEKIIERIKSRGELDFTRAR